MSFSVYRHSGAFYNIAVVNMLQRFSEYIIKVAFSTLLLAGKKFDNFPPLLTSLIYLACIFGGYISDRFLGKSKSIRVSIVLQMACCASLLAYDYIPESLIGLGSFGRFGIRYCDLFLLFTSLLLILSAGLFRPSLYTLVGETGDDSRLKLRCSILYLFNVLGAYGAIFVATYLPRAFTGNTHYLLYLSGLASIINLAAFALYKQASKNTRPTDNTGWLANKAARIAVPVLLTFVFLGCLLYVVFYGNPINNVFILSTATFILVCGYFFLHKNKYPANTFYTSRKPGLKENPAVLYGLFFTMIIFWFLQNTLIYAKPIYATFNGIALSNWNGIFLLVVGASTLFALPAIDRIFPEKFQKVIVALGFLVFTAGFMLLINLCSKGQAGLSADGDRMQPPSAGEITNYVQNTLLAFVFIQSIAELFIAPIIISYTIRFSPAKYSASFMGIYFLCYSIGDKLSYYFSLLYPVGLAKSLSFANPINFFYCLIMIAALSSFSLFTISKTR